MEYAISSAAACQEQSVLNPRLSSSECRELPWYASKLRSTPVVHYDVRSAFRRTCDIELAEQGGGDRDNTILYDMGPGGTEIQFIPRGWPGADKLTRPRDIVFSQLGHWAYPTQMEIRQNPYASPWYTPTQETIRLPGREFIVRRPTGGHPEAGTSPDYQANRLRNAQKAKARCRRLIRKYFRYVRMWTLTFADNEQNVKYADTCFRRAMRRFHDYFKGRGEQFHYVAVREWQERGAVHYHVFVNQYIPKEPRPGELSMDEVWTHGHTWVSTSIRKRKTGKEYTVQTTFKTTKNGDALARYLSKYIIKSLEDPETAEKLEGHHLYLRSLGLFVEKVAVWSSLGKILNWAKATGRKVRRMWKLPVEILTDRGKLILYHYRLDLSPMPSPQT